MQVLISPRETHAKTPPRKHVDQHARHARNFLARFALSFAHALSTARKKQPEVSVGTQCLQPRKIYVPSLLKEANALN